MSQNSLVEQVSELSTKENISVGSSGNENEKNSKISISKQKPKDTKGLFIKNYDTFFNTMFIWL